MHFPELNEVPLLVEKYQELILRDCEFLKIWEPLMNVLLVPKLCKMGHGHKQGMATE